ncbi:MAG TPA: helix-hairpin-helix domain-containing protein [Candidatus Limnocylindria bacterium]|nr:helix-hairpin-helix domain-containing protein [Candidatus Limnocylindria bacterium]
MSRSDRILVAAAAGAIVLAVAAVTVLLLPADGASPSTSDDPAALLLGTPAASVPLGSAAPASGTIVVDVEGAVVAPGIRELRAGSRIADAIQAAGGYAEDADLAAAAAVNLAQPLTDGQQVRVPRVGETAVAAAPSTPAAPGGGGTGPAGGGQVNLNTATPEELEALPGIGEVTVQKIVAARQERPFASLQDAVDRGVINRGQLEDIQGVATAG